MATLTVQTIDLDGLAASYAAASGGGDVFPNDGETSLHVLNGGAGSITVTVAAQSPCNQGTLHDSVTTVGIGAEAFIGPFEKKRFNNTSGQAAITYSGVTSVTIAAIK